MLASLKVMLGMTPPRKPGQREYSPGARSLHKQVAQPSLGNSDNHQSVVRFVISI